STVLINEFNSDKIQRSISGRSSNGTSASLYVNPSILAYNAKNEYVLYKVPKNLRRTSVIPSKSNFRLSQGFAFEIMYQRVASAPCSVRVSKGSTAFPKRFDIFCPFLSSTNPFEMTFLYAFSPKTKVPMACSV